jgi:excinuclease ABC subunit A
MQFMADVELTCEACKGKRFKKDILEVKYHGKNIYDMLEMTIDEAIDFFGSHPGKSERGSLKSLSLWQMSGSDISKWGNRRAHCQEVKARG